MKMTFEDTLKIDVRSKDCLFVEINGITIYIDDSTNELIVNAWSDKTPEDNCYQLMTDEIREKLKKESE